MQNDADHTQGGESGTAQDQTISRGHWARANQLQAAERAAEREHGVHSPQADALHAQAAEARSAALEAGYQSDFQGRIKGLDRRNS